MDTYKTAHLAVARLGTSLCICVYIYVCIYECKYLRSCIYTYWTARLALARLGTSICSCVYACIHVRKHIPTHLYTDWLDCAPYFCSSQTWTVDICVSGVEGCCRVLQSVAGCCRVLQCVTVLDVVRQYVCV